MAERLTWHRARAQRLLTDSATLQRPTETQDPEGNVIVTTATLGPYPCRLESRTTVPLERPEGGQLVAVTLWSAHLPHGTDVRPADVMVVNGDRYEVSDDTDARTEAVDTLVTLRRVS